MKKFLIPAVVALAVPFSVVIAAPASAAPCLHNGGPITEVCLDCLNAAAGDLNAIGACNGFAPAVNTPSPWADCNAMVSATDRANCDDRHLLGQ